MPNWTPQNENSQFVGINAVITSKILDKNDVINSIQKLYCCRIKLSHISAVIPLDTLNPLIIYSLVSIIFINSISSSQRTQCLHYKDQSVNAIHCENQTKLINTPVGKIQFLSFKPGGTDTNCWILSKPWLWCDDETSFYNKNSKQLMLIKLHQGIICVCRV
jgi:hypothetical protein